MKTLKQYLAALVSLCIIAAACPHMTYASTDEYDNTGAIWDSSADVTEFTEANEEDSAFSCETEDTALVLADDVENVRAYRAARGIMSEEIMREMGDAIETEEQQEASFEEHI